MGPRRKRQGERQRQNRQKRPQNPEKDSHGRPAHRCERQEAEIASGKIPSGKNIRTKKDPASGLFWFQARGEGRKKSGLQPFVCNPDIVLLAESEETEPFLYSAVCQSVIL